MELDMSDSDLNLPRQQGTCESMCSKSEIEMREREGLLHSFEIKTDKTYSRKRPPADVSRVVKQFSRPAAGQTQVPPSELRPFPVLKDTVKYLFEQIVPREHPAWTNVYEFVFDRLRAVRQDMVIQGISGQEAIVLLEQVVRFHLYAAYRLRDAAIRDFDPVINKQHLLECLKRLLYLYQVTPGVHDNREEFECVYLLDNLGDIHAITHCLQLDATLRQKPSLKLCIAMNTSFFSGNYTRCLKLAHKLTSVTLLCALLPQLDNLRINLLQVLCVAYHVKTCPVYPIDKLKVQLYLSQDTDVLDLCARCYLTDPFTGPDIVRFDKTKFTRPQQSQNTKSYKSDHWICELDRRLTTVSVSQLLLNGENVTSQQESNVTEGLLVAFRGLQVKGQEDEKVIGHEWKATLDKDYRGVPDESEVVEPVKCNEIHSVSSKDVDEVGSKGSGDTTYRPVGRGRARARGRRDGQNVMKEKNSPWMDAGDGGSEHQERKRSGVGRGRGKIIS